MRLATLAVDGGPVAAVLMADGTYLSIAKAASSGADGALKSGSVQAIVEGGAPVLTALAALVAAAENGDHAGARLPADSDLMAPIPTPRKNIFCVGRNYADHIAEGDRAQKQNVGVTEHPVYFTKPCTAVIGPDDEIPIFPTVSEAIDYEVELALVIGKPGRNIRAEDAFDHIYGYTILNDITARDIQRRHGGQYFKGKGLDGSAPIGPWIVTADEVSDPHKLDIGLTVNGEQRQSGNTAQMIFDIPTLIASLSEGMTLQPGDIIATGTPSGVGYAMEPPKYLKDGDVVVCEVEGIGRLSNTMKSV